MKDSDKQSWIAKFDKIFEMLMLLIYGILRVLILKIQGSVHQKC
jgi:hypothetical protein